MVVPMKTSAVETNNNPCIGKEGIVFFEEFDIFVSRFGHVVKNTRMALVGVVRHGKIGQSA